jgi:hypothetical protein
MDDGSTKEEWKMSAETRKILDPNIAVVATCVRVPVFISHAEAIKVEFERPLSEGEARAALKKAPGVSVVDQRVDEGYVTPAEAAGEDAVFVSRIRRDPTVAHGLSFWCVSDNLRKGAALNAVQIAEVLAEQYCNEAQRGEAQGQLTRPAQPLAVKQRRGATSASCAATSCNSRLPAACVVSIMAKIDAAAAASARSGSRVNR